MRATDDDSARTAHGAICPVLRGARLVLEPMVAAHADALFPLLSDEEIWTYTEDRAPKSLEALRERYRRLESRRSPDGSQLWLNWAVGSPENGPLGFVQASVSESRVTAEIAYVLAKRFWSLGLGSEAVSVLLAFLRDELHVETAVAVVDARNVSSLRLLHKLGFHVTDDAVPQNLRLELPLTVG